MMQTQAFELPYDAAEKIPFDAMMFAPQTFIFWIAANWSISIEYMTRK